MNKCHSCWFDWFSVN